MQHHRWCYCQPAPKQRGYRMSSDVVACCLVLAPIQIFLSTLEPFNSSARFNWRPGTSLRCFAGALGRDTESALELSCHNVPLEGMDGSEFGLVDVELATLATSGSVANAAASARFFFSRHASAVPLSLRHHCTARWWATMQECFQISVGSNCLCNGELGQRAETS